MVEFPSPNYSVAVLGFVLTVQAEVDVHLPVILGLVYVIPSITIIALDNV